MKITISNLLYFSKELIDKYNLKKNQKYLILIDKDENPKEHLYLLRDDKHGYKLY